jgi:uncharacterized protein
MPLLQAADPGATVRVCDAGGCRDQPRNAASFDATRDDNPEETRRMAALADIARQDPRAAFDLGLRYFRGDGVKRDSYQALQWMRSAADRGHPEAQLALGRLYLSGLEEMGADPAEAESWLSLAAARGNQEATRLLAEARSARQTEQTLYQWRDAQRKHWLGWWVSGYGYHWTWAPAGWYHR